MVVEGAPEKEAAWAGAQLDCDKVSRQTHARGHARNVAMTTGKRPEATPRVVGTTELGGVVLAEKEVGGIAGA
jgi:hypothetical protein